MPVIETDTQEIAERPSVPDRVADAVRHAAHVSHKVRLMRSLAQDARDEGVHAVRLAMRRVQRRVETLGDLKDETAHRIKREPLKAIGVAAGVSVTVGFVLGWIASRRRGAAA